MATQKRQKQTQPTTAQQRQAIAAAGAAISALVLAAGLAVSAGLLAAFPSAVLAVLLVGWAAHRWPGADSRDAERWLRGQDVAGLLAEALEPELRGLWQDGWDAGVALGQELTGWDGDVDGMPAGLLDQLASEWAPRIAATYTAQIAGVLAEGGSAAQIAEVLGDDAHAATIAHTEMWRAMGLGLAAVYGAAGVSWVGWVTTSDHPCPVCLENEAEGPVPLGSVFQSGATNPPQHPRCSCVLTPASH